MSSKRQSLDSKLLSLFSEHPESRLNDEGERVIPAHFLVDIFRSLDEFRGEQILNEEETAKLHKLLQSVPNLEVNSQMLLGFVSEKIKSPGTAELSDSDRERGRSSDFEGNGQNNRSSSNDSSEPAHSYSGRRGSLPNTPSISSAFDKRLRSQPLTGSHAPPSSWPKRPLAAHRRKSDAGSRSDSESSSASPRYHRRNHSRQRAPSNPVSPFASADFMNGPASPFGSIRPPSRPSSRPHSRAQSHPQPVFSNADNDPNGLDTSSLYKFREQPMGGASVRRPYTPDSGDSDFDEEHFMERTQSAASLESFERLDALQRANTELSKKLMEAEDTLQAKLFEHEQELEDMQGKLDELKSELNATKREEKELRSKERQNMSQISILENEVAKMTKALEHARTTYTSLQRLYQEQCTISEDYRIQLRERDEAVGALTDAAVIHEVDTRKWAQQHDAYETRITSLERDLEIAQAAHGQLDEQKQENLLLKETIDRMRLDMDELRSGQNGVGAVSGFSSNTPTITKSLGAELLGKLGPWGPGVEDDDSESELQEIEAELGNVSLDSVDHMEGNDTEDVVETIIRRKIKVASRSKWAESPNRGAFEEMKEYSDSGTQSDPSHFYATHSTQTLPPPFTYPVSIQTDPVPVPQVEVPCAQVDLQVPRVMVEVEIQTEDFDEHVDTTTSSPASEQEQIDSLASSSSTILPPTPRASSSNLSMDQLHGGDLPPAYNQISPKSSTNQQRSLAATLRKLHPGSSMDTIGASRRDSLSDPLQGEELEDGAVSFGPIVGGVSQDVVDDWNALQDDLGVRCSVIEKIIAKSLRRPSGGDGDRVRQNGNGRLYNIYNKFYIGDKSGNGDGASLGVNKQNLPMWVGAGALVLLAMSPYMLMLLSPAAAAMHYSIPGGPTYYDRVAWSSFNGMHAGGEGFGFGYGSGTGAAGVHGTAVVWNFLGRVGDGAVRIARGWPT